MEDNETAQKDGVFRIFCTVGLISFLAFTISFLGEMFVADFQLFGSPDVTFFIFIGCPFLFWGSMSLAKIRSPYKKTVVNVFLWRGLMPMIGMWIFYAVLFFSPR